MFDPLHGSGVVRYLAVEDEETCLKLGYPFAYRFAVRDEHGAAFRLRGGAIGSQSGISQHSLDRHAGRLQTTEKLNPGKYRLAIHALTRPILCRDRDQTDAFVIPDGVDGQARPLRDIANLHGTLLSTTCGILGLRVCSRSSDL
jgi:hypothetical protein